jgi:NAD(P)-dependent dehydrogenase (short-subunit alcohol dehydrogenase family)
MATSICSNSAREQAMRTTPQLFDLTGNVAVVTGAGSGLGVVFAEALAEAGAAVVCADLNLAGAEQTAERLRQAGHVAHALAVDVTDETAVERLVSATLTRFQRLDILVNNAGVAAAGPPEDVTLADWQRVLDVNLTGVFLGCQAAGRAMLASGRGGRIINIASVLGAGASQPVAASAYAAAKGAVINLTRDLAVHWAPHGILVNAIGPAYFPSAMTHDFLALPEMLSAIERRTPLGRVGRLEELKGPLVFLASDAASYVTGQTLFVDGGWTAL